ncbi:NB-ARC domain-containing protein [Sedimentitalea sp. JM2-8]|uniref:NB-ARC domain-containing protein n=1 Tax=Sedimentitalea xiamensis TaxID=3050037 RepID=A0ABT7FGS2_9RHOB|nr:NB-ARC domain-containing protein [Sedimentitalea xiamensis]MDK3074278.1 NB-ARC domain-containing protein [Sedimentitalea xiamensis]
MERVERNGDESDVTRFWELTYAAEFLTKLVAATLVAAIDSSKDRHQYSLEHRLVRADGIGDWVQALEQCLTGPASASLNPNARDLRTQVSQREKGGGWRRSAILDMQEVLRTAYDPSLNVKEQPSLRLWFNLFVQLRNKAKGHGAPTPAKISACVEKLEASVRAVMENSPVADLEWCYLHRNISGKYRVKPLSTDTPSFESLKTKDALSFPNLSSGVYIWLGAPRRVNLLYSDQDCSDFLFPNGDFKKDTFELHSLLSDDRKRNSSSDYQLPPSAQPDSETKGSANLDTLGNVFTNIPIRESTYIDRPTLEKEVLDLVSNDRHPIVTLVGRGGIGKTSLALQVLHSLAFQSRYELIVWFSSRDIDLIQSGAKQVRPNILTDRDTAEFFRELVGWPKIDEANKKIDVVSFMSKQLSECDYGPTLFVFDNFETLQNPQDFYAWLDLNIRLPNKILITSRFRDFKGDFPVEISGMGDSEARQLVLAYSRKLGIKDKVVESDIETILSEAEGHPYIIKILLGEIADRGAFSKPSKLLAKRDDILNALFERTFSSLSPLAARIFLTLSAWKSSVPQLVVEASLLRHAHDGIDPENAIDELVRMSLIERSKDDEGIDQLGVPLSAAIFGREKLQVASSRSLIMEDVRFLQSLGAADRKTDSRSLLPRLQRLFEDSAKRIESGSTTLGNMRPVLEFVARGYPRAWLLLARLERDTGESGWEKISIGYYSRYLQVEPKGEEAEYAWNEILLLYQQTGDEVAEVEAFLSMSEISKPPLGTLSSMANRLNSSSKLRQDLAPDERAAVLLRLASLIEPYREEATATDLSRLGWLYLNSGEVKQAKATASIGLEKDPENTYCKKIMDRLADQ